MHLGVTGEDLVREMIPDADDRVVLIEGLGFGYANVVVAVPQAWIDVRSMADLDDVATAFRLHHDRKMRVATKYVNLTRGFFSAHGIIDYRIVESSGATEGAPAAGTAETDRRHHHHRRDARRQRAEGDRRRRHPALAGQSGGRARRGLGRRPNARSRASFSTASPRRRAPAPFAKCARALPAATRALVENAKERFGVVAPFGGPTSSGMLTLHCPPAQVYALASFLRERGAEAVAVADLDYVFARDNPLYAKLEAGL